MDDWEKAGKIAAEALKFGMEIAKPGIRLFDLAEQIEDKIFELGGKPAFPVNLSLRQIASHYTPVATDLIIYNGTDLLKIDVGVHVNGCIGDTAGTVGENKRLIKAAEEALMAAIPLCVPGRKLCEIGREIEKVISSHGFKSITNLCGHSIAEYNIHAGLSIPNHDNGLARELKGGMIIAIEPFATDGEAGLVSESSISNIFRLVHLRPVRDMTSRKILKHITEEYAGLPFASRWLEKKFGNVGFQLRSLVKDGILHSYPQLPEASGGMVSQAEHTIRVSDKPAILTK